jgi:transcriptional regulator with XRE-family HTH domain
MTGVSQKFVIALKLHPWPAYRIAQEAHVDPVTLSKLVNGIIPCRPDDERILRVAAVLGLSGAEVFERGAGNTR